MSIRSRTPASSSRSLTISSTKTASWTCGVREARLFKYGSGTGSNFSSLRGANEKLSGGGKSSGLMSFLKIGDRAAGAIKSGGTTRRAAKMVVVDVDHPDIEEYINWKVKEEQKVAALVAGSKICQKRLAAGDEGVRQLRCGWRCLLRSRQEPGSGSVPSRKRVATRCPNNYILRVIQFARQGYRDIEFSTYDTDWDSEAYLTVSGQNSNNSGARHRRVLEPRRGRRRLGVEVSPLGQAPQDAEGTRSLGADRLCGVGLGRSRHPVPHHDQRLATRAPSRVRSAHRTRARSTCSSTTLRATSPPST